MDSQLKKLWREAVIMLIKDPKTNVCCPTCKSSFLEVVDSEISYDLHFDRTIFCKVCGGMAAIRMNTNSGKDI